MFIKPIHYVGIVVAAGTLLLCSTGFFAEPTLAHSVSRHYATHAQKKKLPVPHPTIATVQPASLTSPMSVEGAPTISVAFIEQVFTYYGSPAAGTGQQLYDLGVQYNINPAFALAFFQHESSFGKYGEATTTLSLGNLRCIPGAACINNIDGTTCLVGESCYAAFPNWADGYQAYYKLIRNLYINTWRLRTVEQIIPRYAPSADNNDEMAYINSVETTIRVWSRGVVVG